MSGEYFGVFTHFRVDRFPDDVFCIRPELPFRRVVEPARNESTNVSSVHEVVHVHQHSEGPDISNVPIAHRQDAIMVVSHIDFLRSVHILQ